jgi:hypothetical protein
MLMVTKVSTLLDAPAARVWDAVREPRTLVYVARGSLRFTGVENWPDRWQEGDTIRTRFVLFHLVPAPWLHELRVVRVDDDKREVCSNERGGPIRRWDHAIQIEPLPGDRCRYTDGIEIDAGLLTPLVWAYAQLFYRYRQMRWRKLARSAIS